MRSQYIGSVLVALELTYGQDQSAFILVLVDADTDSYVVCVMAPSKVIY
jgi:hypothetical protein